MNSLSVVVPAFNSEHSLPDLIERTYATLISLSVPFEIILVNDCSHDGTWTVISAFVDKYECIRGIDLMRNYGQHSALLCGIRAAQNEIIVTIDDDLQNPPEEIPKLTRKLAEGFDVVYGTPKKLQHNLWRNLASKITKWMLQTTMGSDTAKKISAFRAFRTCIRDAFFRYDGPFPSIDVLLTWGTTRFAAIQVAHDARLLGKSNYTMHSLVRHTLNMLTGFSTMPLRLATIVGFGAILFGVCVLIYVFTMYLVHGRAVPGFAFLASIITTFAGVQLFSLGLIGEYLAKVHFRTMSKPSFMIRTQVQKRASNYDIA